MAAIASSQGNPRVSVLMVGDFNLDKDQVTTIIQDNPLSFSGCKLDVAGTGTQVLLTDRRVYDGGKDIHGLAASIHARNGHTVVFGPDNQHAALWAYFDAVAEPANPRAAAAAHTGARFPMRF